RVLQFWMARPLRLVRPYLLKKKDLVHESKVPPAPPCGHRNQYPFSTLGELNPARQHGVSFSVCISFPPRQTNRKFHEPDRFPSSRALTASRVVARSGSAGGVHAGGHRHPRDPAPARAAGWTATAAGAATVRRDPAAQAGADHAVHGPDPLSQFDLLHLRRVQRGASRTSSGAARAAFGHGLY